MEFRIIKKEDYLHLGEYTPTSNWLIQQQSNMVEVSRSLNQERVNAGVLFFASKKTKGEEKRRLEEWKKTGGTNAGLVGSGNR